MPATGSGEKSSYMKSTLKELKQMAADRGIPRSGSKTELAARLEADDAQITFPFLKLPPELRIIVYGLVIEDHGTLLKTPGIKRTEVNSYNIRQPALFRTSHLIRHESFDMYFQQRHFSINFYTPDCPGRFMAWFHGIGKRGRDNIRHLEFTYSGRSMTPTLLYMCNIHIDLSDDACVSYTANAECLRTIGHKLLAHNKTVETLKFWYLREQYNITTMRVFSLGSNDDATVVFPPGQSWFGSAGKRVRDGKIAINRQREHWKQDMGHVPS